MKTLIVLRHAKAEHTPGVLDFERGLTHRGQRNAREAGVLIGPLKPDLVLSSSSKRTKQTAELLGLAAPLELDRDIYEAYTDELLVLIRQVGPEVGTLVLVGHNPSVHELVMGLTGDEVETFPPGAFAVVELPGPWSEVDSGTGTLVDTHRP
ncbi:phosphohistidine phosphatase [Acrocarpospora pleiomorpha]|uniref:Phosphohistidine phosphatase n=1 Tax=Acrocarpospora pleiomorpha TaxID=90975 RepID=A0A5M3XU62_9ACTN|nr:histidine phosphatase family protein [Acrocarpospora pleiomorpha]GES24420.1 phosphohistidine phosphatase [Acrocarpospora pleiomorpha]